MRHDRPLPRPSAWLAPLAMKAAELERVTAERDAARDLAARLEGMLASVEALHGQRRTPTVNPGCWGCGYVFPCPTYRLAHGTDQ